MVNHGLMIVGARHVAFSEVRRKAVPGTPSCRVIRDAVSITLAAAGESAVAAVDCRTRARQGLLSVADTRPGPVGNVRDKLIQPFVTMSWRA